MKLLVLGSGATAGTLPECPVVAHFGSALAARRPDWRAVYPSLARVVQHLGIADDNWDLAKAWARVDYCSKLSAALGTADYGADASYELRKAALDVYGAFAKEAIVRALDAGKRFRLRDIMEATNAGDVIASFNWDVVAETIAETSGRRLVQAPYPRSADERTLIKPHGCVSWRETPAGSGQVALGPRPNLDPMTADEVGEQRQPFMLGAVPIKSELIREAQTGTRVFESVMAQWSSLVHAIREADRLTVVGYSFPTDDGYGGFLFGEAARQRARPLGGIDVYGLDEDRDRLVARVREIFRGAPDPIWCGQIPDP